MHVGILDLPGQYAKIRQEMLAAVTAAVDNQASLCNGQAVRTLESELASYCQVKAALGVSSGTDALLCAMMALGIGPGDEVVTTPFTFFATAGCIWRTGARPTFVDILPDTFNIDPSKIEAAITPKTKAILPVHLYGQCADMDPILEIGKRRSLPVIEDAAQAIGATYKGRQAGSMGAAGCLSFYPTKNLGAIGDAGMVLTQDAPLAERLAMIRNHGQGKRAYYHHWVGGNFRMDSVQAAALSVKLKYLEGWSAQRRQNAARYDRLLAGVKGVVTPAVRSDCVHVYHQYVIRVPRRDELQAFLKSQGIVTGIYYPLSLHQQECFQALGYRAGDFPAAEKAAREVLALPVHPELSDEQIGFVAAKIAEFLR